MVLVQCVAYASQVAEIASSSNFEIGMCSKSCTEIELHS